MVTQEESFNWDIINKVRKATKGCVSILKDKGINQYQKEKSLDLSFGLGKTTEEEDDDDQRGIESSLSQKFNQYKEINLSNATLESFTSQNISKLSSQHKSNLNEYSNNMIKKGPLSIHSFNSGVISKTSRSGSRAS